MARVFVESARQEDMIMSDEELEQVDREESKEEKKEQGKRDVKLAITSIVATLLFIIILLLLVLLGVKKCSNDASNGSSSSPSSSQEPIYNYDSNKLEDKFLNIVNAYRVNIMGEASTELSSIKAVTYIDDYNNGKFSLSISALSTSNKLYYYQAKDSFYPDNKSSFNNLLEYLLLEGTPDVLDLGDTNTEYSCGEYNVVEEKIEIDSDKQDNHFVVSTSLSGTEKYIDGFYCKEGIYHVYHHQTHNGSNPFIDTNNSVDIDYTHPLFTYYQKLSA